jgi:transposase
MYLVPSPLPSTRTSYSFGRLVVPSFIAAALYLKKVAASLTEHREVLLNYFRAKKAISGGVIEGLNNKVKVTFRRSYGFRTAEA